MRKHVTAQQIADKVRRVYGALIAAYILAMADRGIITDIQEGMIAASKLTEGGY